MKKLNQSGFHLIIVPIVIAVLAVVGLAGWNFFKHGNKLRFGNSDQGGFAQQYQDCKERDVAFTSAPMKLTDLGYIRPLGAMLDGHVTPTDHVYVAPKNPQAADNTYPVLMPADGEIVEISRMPDQYIGDRKGTQLAPEDHRIVISFSCRYYAIYIHIHKLAAPLASQVKGIKAGENKKVSLTLKAGDTVGYIGGSSFDWTPLDTKSTLKGFISPELYAGESWKIHTISPFDLYTGSLKSQLEALSLRSVAPVGGKIDYDQPGMLVGTWFREGSGGYSGNSKNGKGGGDRYWDGHLSVVPDYIDPTYTIVSIGNWQDKATQFLVKGSVDPSKTTTASGITKYELTGFSYEGDAKNLHPISNGTVAGTIAFEVQPGEKLKVEKFPGKTAAQVTGFTSAAQVYER